MLLVGSNDILAVLGKMFIVGKSIRKADSGQVDIQIERQSRNNRYLCIRFIASLSLVFILKEFKTNLQWVLIPS